MIKPVLIFVLLIFACVVAALFVAKVNINLDEMKITVERPLTGLLFGVALFAALIEENIIKELFDLF